MNIYIYNIFIYYCYIIINIFNIYILYIYLLTWWWSDGLVVLPQQHYRVHRSAVGEPTAMVGGPIRCCCCFMEFTLDASFERPFGRDEV